MEIYLVLGCHDPATRILRASIRRSLVAAVATAAGATAAAAAAAVGNDRRAGSSGGRDTVHEYSIATSHPPTRSRHEQGSQREG